MAAPLNIAFIGCGNMGGAMLDGFMARFPEHIYTIIKPTPPTQSGVNYFATPQGAKDELAKADIIFLAVKPQIMGQLINDTKPFIPKAALLISIAAGITLARYEQTFPQNPIIRTLPNTPSKVGKAMNLLIGNDKVTQEQTNTTQTLFDALGQTYWLDNEDNMDAASAISASGPAYIFYVIEALAKAGEDMGLPPKDSMQLARQTVIGAAALAEADSSTPAATLRENVTSAKGMTEAALKIFMNGEMQDIFTTALKAARDRSKELGN